MLATTSMPRSGTYATWASSPWRHRTAWNSSFTGSFHAYDFFGGSRSTATVSTTAPLGDPSGARRWCTSIAGSFSHAASSALRSRGACLAALESHDNTSGNSSASRRSTPSSSCRTMTVIFSGVTDTAATGIPEPPPRDTGPDTRYDGRTCGRNESGQA